MNCRIPGFVWLVCCLLCTGCSTSKIAMRKDIAPRQRESQESVPLQDEPAVQTAVAKGSSKAGMTGNDAHGESTSAAGGTMLSRWLTPGDKTEKPTRMPLPLSSTTKKSGDLAAF